MKYIPNIIPQEKKVDLTPYFKELSQITPKSNMSKGAEILGALCLVLGLIFIFSKFFIGFFFILAGISLLSALRKIVEEILQFSFTTKLQKYFIGILFVLGIPVYGYYHQQEEALLLQQQEELRQISFRDSIQKEENRISEIQKEQLRLALVDSINTHLIKARGFSEKKNYNQAVIEYRIAQQFLPLNSEVKYETALCYKKMKSFDKAIQSFEELKGYNDSYFQIALCYEGKGNKGKAVAIYKQLRESGNKDAAARYEKINPLKKRVSYYQTVCCDGTFSPSNSKGRGACSHHGGVCNWDYPIYEEYREYE